ncbi:hypothetical protein DRE_04640 [Drechslerella stenobrocha 248]|uniref:Uncharacterized protein n=1 Tax=Drechslerella stenobrocha 248 TaxID=1043628 RepID=W7HPM0_9PEZI|nr:hypothetical protein DRE_04640 [Drechslerella stenobrocha 248]
MLIAGIVVSMLLIRGIRSVAIPDILGDSEVDMDSELATKTGERITYSGLPTTAERDPEGHTHEYKRGLSGHLQRRQADLIEITAEDITEFQKQFVYSCKTSNKKIATVREIYSISYFIGNQLDAYEMDGWRTPGVLSLGNQIRNPTKWAECTHVHCLTRAQNAVLELCPTKPDSKFTFGFGISRELLARALRVLTRICTTDAGGKEWGDGWVTPFSLRPKDKIFEGLDIRGTGGDCGEWTGAICQDSAKDEYKASQCLVYKGLWGIGWSGTGSHLPAPSQKSS